MAYIFFICDIGNFPFYVEPKEELGDSCSVNVYSIQACITNDPTMLWNVEFIQAKEILKEPP